MPQKNARSFSPSEFQSRILGWYHDNHRVLPWRENLGQGGNAVTPYAVWLSEIMLQQTRVETVVDYYQRWLARFPTLTALALADQQSVLKVWEGLGYYARARNLLACAREVARIGALPDTEAGLRALPGIGAYTAAAIAAIAFGRRAVVVDGNVERVVTRLFALDDPLPGARPAIRVLTDSITPDLRAGDFAQAMMDLGATICTVRNHSCLLCPLAPHCAARAQAIAESLPVKPPKKAKPQRTGTAFWIEQDGQVLLVQRPGKGMLGGMRALPDDGWAAGSDGTAEPPVSGQWQVVDAAVVHVFTHFSLQLALALYRGPQIDKVAIENLNGIWWPVEHIAQAGLPTLFAKAAVVAIQYR